MKEELIKLTEELIRIDSVSCNTNKNIIDNIELFLKNLNFKIEIISYKDSKGVDKYNLVAKRGENSGGLAFLMHTDTVPLADKSQLDPYIKNDLLYGRGACDMKGPIAAALLAIKNVDINTSFMVIATSDEEVGCEGAEYLVKHSDFLKKYKPSIGIATEPTELKPVYAHKGLAQVIVTAYGKAAHSSTGIGESSNFKLIPFMEFVSKLREKYEKDESYQNHIFNPSTNTLNLVMTDFNCALNITPPKSRCKISLRTMPDSRTEDIIKEMEDKATQLGLESYHILHDNLYTEPDNPLVKLAENITGNKGETVAYLTDASQFTSMFKSIILGPGSIKQAHTVDEFINTDILYKGYICYKEIIEKYKED